MKKLLLLCLFIQTIVFSQTPAITNCAVIPTVQIINSSTTVGAIAYQFQLTNITTAQVLTVNASVPSAALSSFVAIITYNSNYKVRVRANIGTVIKPKYTVWSAYCNFSLGNPPLTTSIANIPCNSTITDSNTVFQATPVLGATCYTFYVTNLTTGQSTSTGCVPSGSFILSSLAIPFNYTDVISVSVSYSIGTWESQRSKSCRYQLNLPAQICDVIIIEPDHDAVQAIENGQKYFAGPVGNRFFLIYEDSGDWPSEYYPAAIDAYDTEIHNVMVQVLLDLEAFLFPNTETDLSCGNQSQRMFVKLSPYTQTMIDDNFQPGALAVAGQVVNEEIDLNYLGQGCPAIPNVYLYNNYGYYGDAMAIHVGDIYINPVNSNFNYDPDEIGANFAGEFDLYSILLHEMLHVLGITIEDYKFQDFLYGNHTITSMDLEDELYNTGHFACGESSDFGTLSTSTCSIVHFDGNILINEPMYAPAIYVQGSSLSHFPDECGVMTIGSNVMNPFLSTGVDYKRCMSQLEVYAVQELGYNVNDNFNGCGPYTNSANSDYVIGNHDGLHVQGTLDDEGYYCNDFAYTQISQCFDQSWPLMLSPLINDVNADFISEAVVITGGLNATVTISPGNQTLEFTPNQPGLYTIGYIPTNSTSGKVGLPTYIEVWVPNCSTSTPSNLVCNSAPECSQICFDGTVYDHTLLRGNGYTSNTDDADFTPFNKGFRIHTTSSQVDNTSNMVPCYSSDFFWIDTDVNKEYSLSFERKYLEPGSSSPDPDVAFYVYLAKSSDMIGGQVDQTGNNFPSIPASSQLLYHELFAANSYPFQDVSFCFNATDDYDIIFFYCEQQNDFAAKKGTLSVRYLEFMEKEFVQDDLTALACIPDILTLGVPFCAVESTIFDWTSQLSGTSVSSNQIYNAGTIAAPLADQFTLTMSYPALPITSIIPTENASCSENYSIVVDYVECCSDGSFPLQHPLVPQSTLRTFGEDVDADANGNLYYSGELADDIQFGSQSTVIAGTAPEGFIVKLGDNCAEWIVNTDYRNSHMEVTDAGRIYYSGLAGDNASVYIGDTYFAEIDPVDGSVIWTWNVSGGTPYITDFKVNESQGYIILTGYCSTSFQYDTQLIPVGSSQVFVLKTALDGTYLDYVILGGGVPAPVSKVSSVGADLFVAYESAVSPATWTLSKLDASLDVLLLPASRDISGSGNFNIINLEQDGSSPVAQVEFEGTISDVTITPMLLYTAANPVSVGCIQFDPNLIPNASLIFEGELFPDYFTLYVSNKFRPDIDLESGISYISYVAGDDLLHILAIDMNTLSLSWDQVSTPSSWVGTRGIKRTPSGIYNTGSFFSSVDIDGNIISANAGAATFYGIKYDPSGNVTAMVLNNTGQVAATEPQEIAPLSVLPENNSDLVSIYPNPGTGVYTVESTGEFFMVIYDLNGKIVYQLNGSDKTLIDLSEFESGIYITTITTENSNQVIKLVKQ